MIIANLVHQRQLPSFPRNLTVEYTPAPMQGVPRTEGMSFRTSLAIGATLAGVAVVFYPKASKEWKVIAQRSGSAFAPQDWPGQVQRPAA